MPSTKRRPAKKSTCPFQNKDVIDEFRRRANCKLLLLEQRLQRTLSVLDNVQETFLAMHSEADLNKTIGQLREEYRLREEAKKHTSTLTKSTSKRKLSKDDGYITEATGSSMSSNASGSSVGTLPPPKSVKRLSRSLSRSTTKNLTSTTSSSGVSSMGPPSTFRGRPRRSSSTSAMSKPLYKTPITKRMVNFPPITPKVAPNTPITVLRRPRKGEMILSLSGSPLLPGSGVDEMPSCNIPLEDGTLLSLVPHKLRKSQFQLPMEYMAPNTYHQLAQLKNNIDIVCKMIEKNSCT